MNNQYDPKLGRRMIEVRLVEAGWVPRPASRSAMADAPVALHEYSAGNARIDYALYEDDRVLAIVEAAHSGENPSPGIRRAGELASLIEQQPRYQGQYGVPFLYFTDGTDIHFRDVRRRQNYGRQLAAFHTPGALRELVTRDLDSELAFLQSIPLSHASLRQPQADAIRAMEEAISAGRRKMILSMATGTGKTITVLNEIYRLMKAGIARRVLILQQTTMLVAQTTQLLSSLEVEPGVPLTAIYPVYTPILDEQTITEIEPAAALAEARFVQISRGSDAAELLGERQKSTAAGEGQIVGERPGVPIHTFDLIIVDDCDLPPSGSYQTSWREVVDYFDAINIGVSTTAVFDGADKFDNFIVYRYDFNAAVRDGSLVNSDSVSTRPTVRRWRTLGPDDDAYKRHSVFLSYAREDASDAAAIAQTLREYGIDVWSTDSEIATGEFLFPHILNELKNQDVFVFLLSPASISSPWVENQLDAILERRGVEIIPALLKPCPVPRALADRTIVDLSSGVQGLVDCLEANARIDLRALSPRSFEGLTLDLLRRLYFDFDESIRARDYGYDFRATFRDSLGFADAADYLIQIKAHKNERSSVNALQAFAKVIASDERRPHGLLVTNNQLTSVAAKALIRINDTGIQLRVIDGRRFKNLLLRYPDLITGYFMISEVVDGNG